MRQGYQLLRLAKLKMFLTHSFYVRLNAHAQFKHKECQNQVKVLTNLAHFNLPFKPLLIPHSNSFIPTLQLPPGLSYYKPINQDQS